MAQSLPQEDFERESGSFDVIRLLADRKNFPKIGVFSLFLGGLFLFAIGAGLFFFKNQSSGSDIQIISSGFSNQNVAEIVVDVSGEVKTPGVYKLAAGLRVNDAIAAAGGFTQEADKSKMNLAAKAQDGQKIYVPAIGGQMISNTGQVISESSGLININSAPEAELDKLPGVGPVTAQKIIASRPYSTLDDLLTKKAVSSSVFSKIKDLVTY